MGKVERKLSQRTLVKTQEIVESFKREIKLLDITSMKKHPSGGSVNVHAKGVAEVDPKYSPPPPPRNGKDSLLKCKQILKVSHLMRDTCL